MLMTCLTKSPSKQTRYKAGYVTIFFTLALSLIVPLLIGMIYSVRKNAIVMKTVSTVNTGMISEFAEYNRELWEQYGLIFVDSSYMSKGTGMITAENHLKECINKNFDECRLGLLGGKDLLKLECSNAETTGVCLATDNNFAAMKHQAVNLMKYHYKIAYIDEVSDWVNTIDEYGLSQGVSYDGAGSASNELNSHYGIDYSGWVPSTTGGNDLSEDNIWSLGILGRVTDISRLSTTQISNDNYAWKRELNKGNLAIDYDFGIEDAFFLREYALEMCGDFINEKDNSVLKYQTEYLVTGKESDPDNLAGVARRIMVIREAANMITLCSDTERINEIKTICSILCGLVGAPEAAELLEAIVIACWANFESLADVRIILKGGRIPLIKSCDQWITGIRTALFGEGSIDTYNEGLSYEDYLRIFLYLTGEKKILGRLSSIIEMDVRATDGNEWFRLDNCFDAWEVLINVESKHGYKYSLKRMRKVYE